MKAFRFPLDRVMRWHEQQADKERGKLEHLHGVRSELRNQRTALEDERQAMREHLNSDAPLASHDLATLAAYTAALHTRCAQIREHETACEANIVEQRTRCIEADRHFRVFEKLKEKRRAEWQRELHREIEDAAATSFLANRARELRS